MGIKPLLGQAQVWHHASRERLFKSRPPLAWQAPPGTRRQDTPYGMRKDVVKQTPKTPTRNNKHYALKQNAVVAWSQHLWPCSTPSKPFAGSSLSNSLARTGRPNQTPSALLQITRGNRYTHNDTMSRNGGWQEHASKVWFAR